MSNEEIINLVMNRMDDVSPAMQNSVLVNEAHPLIPSHLDYAAQRLLEMLPVNQQQVFAPTGRLTAPQVGADHILVSCPADFLKLARVKLSTWSRPVVRVINENHPGATMQSYRYMGGTTLRPTAVLVQVASDRFALELRPVSGAAHLDTFLYVKRRKANELEDDLIDPLVWLIAARVFESIKETASAKACYDQLTNYVQGASLKSQDN